MGPSAARRQPTKRLDDGATAPDVDSLRIDEE